LTQLVGRHVTGSRWHPHKLLYDSALAQTSQVHKNMAIPKTITRDHVLQAMQRLLSEGIPDNAESTKFDLIDPSGQRLPPKAVIEIAAELATGKSFPRTRFFGGADTNELLRDLGFEVEWKPGMKPRDIDITTLPAGSEITNDELAYNFKVSNASGMRWSSALNHLVVVADHTKSLYSDGWRDGTYYTGMGRIGGQKLTGQNSRLAGQRSSGVKVYLFEVFEKNVYQFVGPVESAGDYTQESQPDDNGDQRMVFVFPLKPTASGAAVVPTAEQMDRIRQRRSKQLREKTIEELWKLAQAGGKKKVGERTVSTTQYERNEAVSELVKRLADGHCDLCGEAAPFRSKVGPYLECHHIVHLAKGGADTVENAVALCPNCHRRMHVLDKKADRKKLRQRVVEREAAAGLLDPHEKTRHCGEF
jgi:5-methylcytosine-specific restriction enzyme A